MVKGRAHPLVAGNWKMNGTVDMLGHIRHMSAAIDIDPRANVEVVVFPPATLLPAASHLCRSTPLRLGGQDCSAEHSGAYTGDLSAQMLSEAGAAYVIVGHSERRSRYQETNEVVSQKAGTAIRAGLTPIICIGETAGQRAAGLTLPVVEKQLAESIPEGVDVADVVIAYEPVWAIGTGNTPSVDEVSEVHAAMRATLEKRHSRSAGSIRLLYGGSVKPSNAHQFRAIENVDGCLVGGASLNADEFLAICSAFGRQNNLSKRI